MKNHYCPTGSNIISLAVFHRNTSRLFEYAILIPAMKMILNIGSHGDEKIGFAVADEIKKIPLQNGEIIVNVGNERACKENKRFIDHDLNRVFPGNSKGSYEERLACKLLPFVKSADIVIDIHSTTSDLKDALIVTHLRKKTREYIDVITPKYLLCMNVTKQNALISGAKVGIAFEYGKDDDPVAVRKIVAGIKRLLIHLGMTKGKISKIKQKTLYFDVYKKVPKLQNATLLKSIRNYKLVRKGQTFATVGTEKIRAKENFYPILFGELKYKDFFGFAARKTVN